MDYRGALVDLDGTVYRGGELVPGALDGLDTLRERGLDVLFVTNNPTRSPAAYADRLAALGLDVAPDRILSAGAVTATYLAENHAEDRVFVIGSDGLRAQFRERDLHMTEDPERADVVVTSHDFGFDYDDLTAGLWALREAETFVGTDPDLTYPDADGRDFPGSGAITRAVGGVARREPDHVFGKPSLETLDLALARIDHAPSECFVVGDRPDTDVAFGERAGMTTALVLSGSTRESDLGALSPRPDYVLDDLSDVEQVLDGTV
ncbi:HAD-IIA family hydrolase [Halomarina ordinaria]|uniref:HAD-IIA family hydrolase n=1 Tax=Halomarina ordinaria TaxID=3033939 RepID=A0ABD5U7M2_9EURY|nr:HAD-IIA family hydrolase [Halomarina sp. PSRA2]